MKKKTKIKLWNNLWASVFFNEKIINEHRAEDMRPPAERLSVNIRHLQDASETKCEGKYEKAELSLWQKMVNSNFKWL